MADVEDRDEGEAEGEAAAPPIPLYPEGPLQAVAWDAERDGPLTEAAIRGRFPRIHGYTVHAYRYPARARFRGRAPAGLCFVVRGACRFRFREAVVLRAGQYAELPDGDFEFLVLGADAVEFLRVREHGDEEPLQPSNLPPHPPGEG